MIILSITLLGLLGVIAFGEWMDPFAMHHPNTYLPEPNNPARGPLSSYSYVSKSIDIIRYKPQHILLGSSVVDNGFRIYGSTSRWYDPDPQKIANILRSINNDTSYYNASIRGGGIYEAWLFLRHAYANNPHLDKVILGMEWSIFTSLLRLPATPSLSSLNHTSIPLNFFMEYTVSPMAFSKAYFTFCNSSFVNNTARAMRPQFVTKKDVLKFWARITQYMGRWKATFSSLPPAPVILEKGSPSSDLLKDVTDNELRQFVFSVWFTNAMRHRYDTSGMTGLMHPQALDYLRKIGDFCREKHILLEIYLSPQPPIFWAMMRHYQMEGAVNYWLREVAKIYPSLDVSEFIDYNGAEKFFVTDTLHFNEKAGEVLLPVLINADKNLPTGVKRVTTGNVERIILYRKEMLDIWLEQHLDLKNTINSLPTTRLLHSEITTLADPNQMLPALYSPEYKGYNIIKFIGLYFAVPDPVSAPYSLHMLLQHKYPGMLNADSLDNIQQEIDNSQKKQF